MRSSLKRKAKRVRALGKKFFNKKHRAIFLSASVVVVLSSIFGNCLKSAKWWPEEGICRLVREYDFAMRLLKQSGRMSNTK